MLEATVKSLSYNENARIVTDRHTVNLPLRVNWGGGWSDTPPYCNENGGTVLNVAILLNGKKPVEVTLERIDELKIVFDSRDMDVHGEFDTIVPLQATGDPFDPFALQKACLLACGIIPQKGYKLEDILRRLGGGFVMHSEVTDVPKGSGLGTSSILSAACVKAVFEFTGIEFTEEDLYAHVLAMEQIMSTGGGWQDQYGGVFSGVKLLQSEAGFEQNPLVRWLPDQLFVHPDYRDCHLLYYTGITRTAKGILAEIVSSMFLNSGTHLSLLTEMKAHTMDMSEAILRSNFTNFGILVGITWIQNQALDCGTNPPAVAAIIEKIKDYTLGYKLPGAGGGGYLYMVAKDPQAAGLIRRILTEEAPNPRARFVEMSLSDKGLQISRS